MTGEFINPRFVWLVDRACRKVAEEPAAYGINSRDQIVVFSDGSLDIVQEFLEVKSALITTAEALVFLFLGMDDIAVDAPAIVSPAMEAYFHKLGPCQLRHREAADVTAAYEVLVARSRILLPSACIISSNPAPRRSGGGFAMTRAVNVDGKIRSQGSRHHHFSQIRRFHGKRQGKGHVEGQGGQLPVHNRLFDPDGIQLTQAALVGVVVRANTFVEAVVGVEGQMADPMTIDGLKMRF